MTTKFSRRPRVQPTPAICRPPPVPIDPSLPTPPRELHAAVAIESNPPIYPTLRMTEVFTLFQLPGLLDWEGKAPRGDDAINLQIHLDRATWTCNFALYALRHGTVMLYFTAFSIPAGVRPAIGIELHMLHATDPIKRLDALVMS